MKIFISQPLSGIPDELAKQKRLEAEDNIRSMLDSSDIEFLHHTEDIAPDDVENKRVWYLGQSISIMAQADYIVFIEGWENAFGCIIEHHIAELYGFKIINPITAESYMNCLKKTVDSIEDML